MYKAPGFCSHYPIMQSRQPDPDTPGSLASASMWLTIHWDLSSRGQKLYPVPGTAPPHTREPPGKMVIE